MNVCAWYFIKRNYLQSFSTTTNSSLNPQSPRALNHPDDAKQHDEGVEIAPEDRVQLPRIELEECVRDHEETEDGDEDTRHPPVEPKDHSETVQLEILGHDCAEKGTPFNKCTATELNHLSLTW